MAVVVDGLRGCSRFARWNPARAIRARPPLSCFAIRPLSHGSCLLSRVTRRKHVSGPEKTPLEDEARFVAPEDRAVREPPDDYVPGPLRPVKETMDAEGRKYFMSGPPGRSTYHHRHGRSVEGGYVKAAYTARSTYYLNPSTKVLEYGRPIKRPLLILYNCNFVEDDEFWDEISTICDFATSITEREKDLRGYSVEKDIRPVEFVCVQARFHFNARVPDEPWHITVDIGNRQTWDDGKGFFRKNYHIYAKNDNLSQGYAGYRSSVMNTGSTRSIGLSECNKHTDAIKLVPWGQREYFRNSNFRKVLFEATQQSLEPPASSHLRKGKNWSLLPNPVTGALEKVGNTSIPDLLDELLNSIREGASKPAIPAKRISHHVIDHSGNKVHIHEAIKSAISEGREVPLEWKKNLQTLFAALTVQLKATSRLPVPLEASLLARSKTARVPRTTRPPSRLQKRSLRPKDSVGPDKSSAQQLESQSRSKEGLGIREEHTGASVARSGGDIKNQPQESTVPQRPGKSRATKRNSRNKLTIRDPFDKDAGVGQGFPASQELASKASHERKLVVKPDSSQPKAIIRPRNSRLRPGATSRSLDLGRALLNAAPEPVGTPHQREAPDAKSPPSGEASARSRRKKHQKSAAGSLSSDSDSPGSVENDASPSGSGSRNRKPRTRTRGPDARKPQAGKKMSSPPAWELPQDSKEATFSEVHP